MGKRKSEGDKRDLGEDKIYLNNATGFPKFKLYSFFIYITIKFDFILLKNACIDNQPFAKAEFGMDGDVYFTDGPAVYRQQNGKLLILWSSWGEKGYTVGQAVSDSGKIEGPWRHLEQIVFGPDGGHGMFFHTKEGALKYLLHYPNQPGDEHPLLLELAETELGLKATLS